VPVIAELEPAVEAAIDRDIQELLVEGGDEESDVNAKILQAQINAERNRVMSMDTNFSEQSSTVSSMRPRHIQFGNECEVEFDPGSNISKETINEIKSFDGSRSGRLSIKA
jgi:hypothetical protein